MRVPTNRIKNSSKIMSVSKVKDSLRSRIHKANFMAIVDNLNRLPKSHRSNGPEELTPRTGRGNYDVEETKDKINQNHLVFEEVLSYFDFLFLLFLSSFEYIIFCRTTIRTQVKTYS